MFSAVLRVGVKINVNYCDKTNVRRKGENIESDKTINKKSKKVEGKLNKRETSNQIENYVQRTLLH